jgi:predicted NAD/FAD-dependent oxidoreductase
VSEGGRDARPPGAADVPGAADTRPVAATSGRWRLTLADGSYEEADGIVLACPAHVSAGLVRGLDAGLADELAVFATPRRRR